MTHVLPPDAHAAVLARHALIQQHQLAITDLQEGVLRVIEEATGLDLHGADAWSLDLERGIVTPASPPA